MIITIIILSIISLFFAAAYFIKRKKYYDLNSDIAKVIIAIKRLRYGDITVRLDNLNDKLIQTTINRLFETINDRELMIKEYQNTMSKKNLSLKKVIEQEEKLKHHKEEVVATLTHDMKVPVIAELNSINLLLDDRFGELNDKQREVLALMQSSSQELKDLIENILETYKLEEHKFELNKKETNINDFIKNIIMEVRPISIKANHSINADIKNTENVNIEIDEFQIKRVFKNLLSNAISYSKAGTDIKINTYIETNLLKIRITNQGENITEEEIDLIFNKYYTGKSRYRKTSTGLGLFISKQIALLHGGDLTADTRTQGFTSFILDLPLN